MIYVHLNLLFFFANGQKAKKIVTKIINAMELNDIEIYHLILIHFSNSVSLIANLFLIITFNLNNAAGSASIV